MQRDLEQALHRTMACRGVEVMRRDSVRAYKAMAHHDASALTIMLEDKTFRSYLDTTLSGTWLILLARCGRATALTM